MQSSRAAQMMKQVQNFGWECGPAEVFLQMTSTQTPPRRRLLCSGRVLIKEMSLITAAWPAGVKCDASECTKRPQRVQRDPSLLPPGAATGFFLKWDLVCSHARPYFVSQRTLLCPPSRSVEGPRCPAGPPASEGGAARGGDLHPVRWETCFASLPKVFLWTFSPCRAPPILFFFFSFLTLPLLPPTVPAYMFKRKRDKGPPEKEKKKPLHLCEAPFWSWRVARETVIIN